MDDAHRLGRLVAQLIQNLLRAGHLAGERIAHPDGDGGRCCLAFLHHVEMVIEGRHLVDFGLGKAHLGGKGCQMGGREMAVAVLDEMQKFDE